MADLDAAVIYYGTSPEKDSLKNVNAAVYGNYGEMDARVNATIPAAEKEMKRLGKSFEYGIYENAGHGFLRQQSGRDGSNLAATETAWTSTLAFLRDHTETDE